MSRSTTKTRIKRTIKPSQWMINLLHRNSKVAKLANEGIKDLRWHSTDTYVNNSLLYERKI